MLETIHHASRSRLSTWSISVMAIAVLITATASIAIGSPYNTGIFGCHNRLFVTSHDGAAWPVPELLADGNAEFTRALGLELDATSFFMGLRSQRFALVAEDGVVTRLFVEPAGAFGVSSAEHVLSEL